MFFNEVLAIELWKDYKKFLLLPQRMDKRYYLLKSGAYKEKQIEYQTDTAYSEGCKAEKKGVIIG